MDKRPIVGVMPLWDEKKDSIWMLPGYMDGVREAGAIPFIFPLTDDADEIGRLMDMVDGVLLTGGQDVDPGVYGETPLNDTVLPFEPRDRMEHIVLKLALEQDKAVLGICRGIQYINAALGGTLYQDLPTQHPSEVVHNQKLPYHMPSHEVNVVKGSPLYELVGQEKLAVNSYHHQAVKELASALTAMAISTDGLVEAVYMPDKKFFWAVQWHPEFAYKVDDAERKIFEAFVEGCK